MPELSGACDNYPFRSGHIVRSHSGESGGNSWQFPVDCLLVRPACRSCVYHLYDSSKCTSGLQRGPVWQHRLQRRAHGGFSVCLKWHQPRVRASGGIQPPLRGAGLAGSSGRTGAFIQPDILDTIGIKRTLAMMETECRGPVSVFPDESKCPTCITQDLSAASSA